MGEEIEVNSYKGILRVELKRVIGRLNAIVVEERHTSGDPWFSGSCT